MSDFLPPILTNKPIVEKAWMPDDEIWLVDPRALIFDVGEHGNIENPRRILDDENKPLAIIENLI